MSNLRTAAQQALEFAADIVRGKYKGNAEEIRDALSAALEQPEPRNQCGETCERAKLCAICARGLEQPEQEPVASIYVTIGGEREFDDWRCPLPVGCNLLYTHPPRRSWRGLTEEEIHKIALNTPIAGTNFARAVEQALKEKNT